MIRNRIIYIYGVAITLILTLLTYVLQTYRLTSLEEEYIFLYDWTYIWSVMKEPGGFAQLLSSLLTQFFCFRWLSPIIVGIVYGITTLAICRMAVIRKAPLYAVSFAGLPAMCLMLCLENSAYEFQGSITLMLNAVAILLTVRLTDTVGWIVRTITGAILTALMLWLTGFAALVFVAGTIILYFNGKAWLSSAIYAVCSMAVYFVSIICFIKLQRYNPMLYTPEMYYDMGSTYYMMIYAMCSVVLSILMIRLCRTDKNKVSTKSMIVSGIILLVEFGVIYNVYTKIHSKSNYENYQQRYYARHDMWDEILDMPYDGHVTPYTSYVFLALAQKGQLTEKINSYRPYISYIFENKPKVKKRDQQVYSDIYYACDYMAAARHSAFDTNIVTPGAFNPYETQKLAEINIAFGDYEVAEKLLDKLDKTLYYKKWAEQHRKYLFNDSLVESDHKLGLMRKAIPADNFYLSPKGIMRDLKYVTEVNPDNIAAREFYKAFLMMTNQ